MPMANFLTEGMTMTHSASLRRSVGRLSGISRISLRTSPQFWRRSTSFLVFVAAAGMQAKAATQSVATNFFMRGVLMERALVIIMFPDEHSRPQERNRNVDAVGEWIQNLIEIVATEIDVFSATRPEDSDLRAMVRDEEDVDVVRVAFAVTTLAMMFTVFIVVLVIVVLVMTAALDNYRIGFDGLVFRLVAAPHGRGLKPSQFGRADGDRGNVEGEKGLGWEHDLLVASNVSAKGTRSRAGGRADGCTLAAG